MITWDTKRKITSPGMKYVAIPIEGAGDITVSNAANLLGSYSSSMRSGK